LWTLSHDGLERFVVQVAGCHEFYCSFGGWPGGVDGLNRYQDELRVSVLGGHCNKPRKSVQLVWKSPGLGLDEDDLPSVCRVDDRNHKALLRTHFSSWNVVLHQHPGFWRIVIMDPKFEMASSFKPLLIPAGINSFVSFL